MKNIIPKLIIVFILIFSVNCAAENIIYVNGINNKRKDAIISGVEIKNILSASENHQDEIRDFSVTVIWNPIGFYGIKDSLLVSEKDRFELFLQKTAEELYGEDLEKIVVPYDNYSEVDVEAAERVVSYLDDMTPGVETNYLEAEGLVSDEDMAWTQNTIFNIVEKVEELESAVVIGHSQGNLLINLAYAELVTRHGDDVYKMVRVINVANTSEFSVNGLNFTHAGDAALYSDGSSYDVSLETMPSQFLFWRVTPTCNKLDYTNFTIASPTFQEALGVGSLSLRHSFIDAYLSEEVVYLNEASEYDFFTLGAEQFVDRFENFVYAAAKSFEDVDELEIGVEINLISSGYAPKMIGNLVLYNNTNPNGSWRGISLFNKDSNEIRELVENGFYPDYSSLKNKVCFSHGGSLHIINIDGSEGEDVGIQAGKSPLWSPDGKYILTAIGYGTPSFGLILIDTNSWSYQRLFFANIGNEVGEFSWTPEGNILVSVPRPFDYDDWAKNELKIFGIDGIYMKSIIIENYDGKPSSPSLSPDGKYLAFSSGNRGIWISFSDGTNAIKVSDRGGIVSWSLDNKYLVFDDSSFTSYVDNGIFSLEINPD